MSRESSPATGRPYGVQHVCGVLGIPRSTVYARQAAAAADAAPSGAGASPGAVPVKRGPKPFVSDEELLAAIRADLKASPFVGEGGAARCGRG